jgi:hypothetical protein
MIHANPVEMRRGRDWLVQGWTLFRTAPALWLGLSFSYLAIAMLLEQIPFIGWLILVLLSPMFLFGALSVAERQADNTLPAEEQPAAPTWSDLRAVGRYVRDVLLRSLRRLFSGFTREDELLPMMVISTLLLGGVVVIRILAQLFKVGGHALPAMLAGTVGPTVWVTALIGLVVILVLEVLLIMAFLYTVPLLLFRREYPLPAIEASFSAALRNFGALALFAGAFLILGELSRLLFFFFAFPLDYVVFLFIGLVALPILIGALHASYRDLFGKPRVV